MKPLYTAILLLIVSFALPTMNVLASDVDTRGEIENLKKRIENLEGGTSPDESRTSISALQNRLSFWGAIEIDAFYSKTEGQGGVSDIVAATAQLGADIRITDNVGGHLVFLYEEDYTPLEVDEANITLTCPREHLGGNGGLIAGKMYVPFGQFNSVMITDPVTLELGETNNTALILNWANSLVDVQTGVFNGDIDDENVDRIDTLVGKVSLRPMENLTFGFSYMSDLAESGGGLVDTSVSPYPHSVCGVSAFISATLGPVNLDGEVIRATKKFDAGLVNLPGSSLSGQKPQALSIEASMNPMDKINVAVRYESADDFMGNIDRYGTSASYSVAHNTVLAIEYLLTDPDGDTDNTHTVTTELAFTF